MAFRPSLRGRPFVSLGQFPTPVERVEGLLPRAVELWVKREERAGLIYGGNKVRKLEFLLGEALERGKKRVVTIGGWGSHHALATAIYARQHALRCTLHLFPQPMTDHVRAQLDADRDVGAEVHVHSSIAAMGLAVLVDRLAPDALYLHGGGSSPVGTFGWVAAADELCEQIALGALPPVDAIYLALGSCGTAAGLAAGLRGSIARHAEIVAVRVVERPISGLGPARRLEERTLAELGEPARPPVELRVVHDQIGAGYGHETEAAHEAVRRAAVVGLRLETTYTGKALAALIAEAESGRLDGKRVLFIQTYAGKPD